MPGRLQSCLVSERIGRSGVVVIAEGPRFIKFYSDCEDCYLICSAVAGPIIVCCTTRAAAWQVEGSPGHGTARGSAGASLWLRVRGDGLPAAAGCAQHGGARAPVGARGAGGGGRGGRHDPGVLLWEVPALFDWGLGVGVRGGGLPGEHVPGGEAGAGIWLRSVMPKL